MATAKQKAAARKNIKKAQQANRRKGKSHTKSTRKSARTGKGHAKTKSPRKAHRTAKQKAAARKNIKKAQAARKHKGKGHAKKAHAKKPHAKKAHAKKPHAKKHAGGKKKGGHRKAGKRKGGKRKGGKRKGAHHTQQVHTTRTEIIKMPGHTTKVAILPIQTAARHGKRKPGKRKGKSKGKHKKKGGKKGKGKGSHRAREHGYAMENPLGAVEIFVGGLTGLLGFGVADVLDRYLATHALTDQGTKSSAGYEQYSDTPPTSGTYSGLFNATAVIAPMGLLRWGVGLTLTAAPIVIARWVKAPVGRSALQFFGFGVGFRVVGKGLQSLFAYLFQKTSFGLRLYDGEARAAALKSGNLTYNPTTGTEGGSLAGSFPAAGLGAPAIGCGRCANCITGVGACCGSFSTQAPGAQPPPPPPATTPAASVPFVPQTPAPTAPTWVPTPVPTTAAPTIPQPSMTVTPPPPPVRTPVANNPFTPRSPVPVTGLTPAAPGGNPFGLHGVPERRSRYDWNSDN